MTNWDEVLDEFSLRGKVRHLSTMVMASHRRGLDDKIRDLRDGFNRDPVTFLHKVVVTEMNRFVDAAGAYFGVPPTETAQCGSTSQGLGYIYSGIKLLPGERVLTTRHEFAASTVPLLAREDRQDTKFVDVLPQLFTTTPDPVDMVKRLRDAIQPKTRLLALTWVYSSTGVKSPIKDITAMVREVNATRAPENRLLVCVDGVHGFGIENVNFSDLGCDFFVSGTHKWIYGPRGTGVMYGTKEAWALVKPIVWTSKPHTPNGVHAYEHDFAVADAFAWLMGIGKAEIEARVHALATRLKDGLSLITGVQLITPRDRALSSGIVCFDVTGMKSEDVVRKLSEDFDIIATQSATDPMIGGGKHVRLSPGVINDYDDIDAVLTAVGRLAQP